MKTKTIRSARVQNRATATARRASARNGTTGRKASPKKPTGRKKSRLESAPAQVVPTDEKQKTPKARKPSSRRRIRTRRAQPVAPTVTLVKEIPVRRALPVVEDEAPPIVGGIGGRLLKLDRKGEDVAAWQRFLADQGFNPGPVDGFFGGSTRLATIAFQKSRRLTPDGVVGGATRAAIGPVGVLKAVAQTVAGLLRSDDDVIDCIGKVRIFETRDGRAIYFKAGMSIDADGAYRAYKVRNLGLDYDDNGKNPCAAHGRWIGVVTDRTGGAIAQGPNDPAPGYLISTTSLQDSARANTDPMRYVDSEAVPYIVLPGGHLGRASLGDYALVVNTETGQVVHAIAADAGPKHRVGEASIAVARALLGPAAANPRSGGTERAIIRYVVFPGSRDGRFPISDPRTPAVSERTLTHLNSSAATLFASLHPAHQSSLLT